jgi:hypothetical protein
MKHFIQTLCALILSTLTTGCPIVPENTQIFPSVTNLGTINTVFDDMNMAPPPRFTLNTKFAYSTNMGTAGDNFDIWQGRLHLGIGPDNTDIEESDLSTSKDTPFMHQVCNSNADEIGPNIIYSKNPWSNDDNKYHSLQNELPDNFLNSYYVFASNRQTTETDSVFNIFVYNNDHGLRSSSINSDSNDSYPTYHYQSGTLYFCSNRDGQYDIYAYSSNTGQTLDNLLTGSFNPDNLSKVEAVSSSSSHDKMPYVFKNIMVFVSNRDGGAGGYDIYLSRYMNGGWSDPEHIGPELKVSYLETNDNPVLNSRYDEYRPVLIEPFIRDMDDATVMMFSSNRPKYSHDVSTDFDLYLAIIPKEIIN